MLERPNGHFGNWLLENFKKMIIIMLVPFVISIRWNEITNKSKRHIRRWSSYATNLTKRFVLKHFNTDRKCSKHGSRSAETILTFAFSSFLLTNWLSLGCSLWLSNEIGANGWSHWHPTCTLRFGSKTISECRRITLELFVPSSVSTYPKLDANCAWHNC